MLILFSHHLSFLYNPQFERTLISLRRDPLYTLSKSKTVNSVTNDLPLRSDTDLREWKQLSNSLYFIEVNFIWAVYDLIKNVEHEPILLQSELESAYITYKLRKNHKHLRPNLMSEVFLHANWKNNKPTRTSLYTCFNTDMYLTDAQKATTLNNDFISAVDECTNKYEGSKHVLGVTICLKNQWFRFNREQKLLTKLLTRSMFAGHEVLIEDPHESLMPVFGNYYSTAK